MATLFTKKFSLTLFINLVHYHLFMSGSSNNEHDREPSLQNKEQVGMVSELKVTILQISKKALRNNALSQGIIEAERIIKVGQQDCLSVDLVTEANAPIVKRECPPHLCN